ncbi:latent-transforming growth factor beta-binding protein 4 isoform X4 [Entelurus aequoreus]|uniref:latent-transforming growth factor beta-binding protein 4 isoform X4 n=1 Tax=Entelurus aequoreus TaxID=161455 RepID=UPI002B1DE53D|nr:latent-transforming growth factor beta-binding protein 4 isoform X4 [Entelurus aequoreus]
MRVHLLCLWLVSVHASRENRGGHREGGQRGAGLQARSPGEVRGAAGQHPGRAAKKGSGAYADRCCQVRWITTNRCVKRRCLPGCRGAASCPKALPSSSATPGVKDLQRSAEAPPVGERVRLLGSGVEGDKRRSLQEGQEAKFSAEERPNSSRESRQSQIEDMKPVAAKKTFLSLREAQAVLLKKTVGGRRDKIAAALVKHIEKEKKKLGASTSSFVSSNVRTSKAREGNVTTVLCPLLCKNGGVCLLKDRCLCPSNFTGKFCQIPVAHASTPSSTNEVVEPAGLSVMAANQGLTQSEFLLPLAGPNQAIGRPASASSPSMVKVRVQHPLEASVKVHQVMKVSGFFPALQALSSATQSGSAGAPAPAGLVVQAQTTRGDGVYTQHSGFKYCFREVKDGQCSSPLPGLRSKETCCRGLGKAWGATDCVLCPKHAAGPNNSSCPVGFERGNGTKCVDVNECLQPGLCENGVCVNTRGSYSCVCKPGFILDASHGICISQTVIAEDKNQCYRVLGSGLGPSSCSLPILRNITKQICCCSRVGKAWGPDCQRCPYFGSVAFKEICPAGPGYHYSPSAVQFSQRAAEHLGTQGAQLVTHLDQGETTSSQPKPPARETVSSSNRTSSPVSTPPSRHVNPVNTTRHKPQTPGSAGVRPTRPRPTISTRRSPQQSSGGQDTSGSQNQGTGRSQTSNQNQESSGNRNTSHTQGTSRNPSPSGGQITSRNQGTNQNQGTSRIQGPNVNPVSTQNQGTSGNRNTGQTQGTSRIQNPSGGQGTSRNQGTNQNQGISKDQSPSGGQGTSRNQGTNQNQGISRDQSPSGGQGTSRNQGTNQNQGISRDQSPSGGQGTSRIQGVSGSEDRPTGRGDSLPASAQRIPEGDSRTGGQSPPPKKPTTRPPRVQSSQDVCASKPGVCGGGRCVSQPGGKHTCVCDHGYQANSERTHCQDVNECVQPGGVCSPGECVNSAGSFRCVCPSGYSSDAGQRSCQDVDECQRSPCGSDARCHNTAGSFRCVCRHGYKLSGNTCTDVDECEDPLLCPGQQCVNTQGSYRCVSCQPGHGLLNGLCTDIDECRQAPCSNGRCENTPGSFRCVCRHGYKLKNNTCTDVDECAEPSQCPDQVCVNSVGSYRCVSCQTGYTLTNRQCTDVNECKDEALCPGGRCVNTEGSYKCVDCRQGYHAVNRVCEDIDECASASACEAEGTCVNTLGSFRCDCLPGYRTFGRGRQCRDINECLEENWCPPTGECVNTAGSYTCVCPQGFSLGSDNNRTACVDVNECERSRACADGDCVNTDGSFLCRCHDGFTNNPERNTCLDVDECVSSGGSVCGALRCENTIGSYRCLTSCDPGFQVSAAGQCEDVDECVNRTVCGDHAVCQNVVGTYVCLCDQGFTSTSDGKFCVDEDECVSMPGVCGSARCDNMEGSFMCECDTPGEEFDTTSRRCVSTPPSPPQRGTFPIGSSSPSSSTFHAGVFDLAPVLPRLPAAGPGELRECYYNLADSGSCSLLAANTSQQECCCTLGEGWGLGCQYHACPLIGTADFLSLCPSGRGYVSTGAGAFSYTDVDECKRFYPEVCKSGVCVNNIPGYNCYCSSGFVYSSTLLECVDLDECEQETCFGGQCVNTIGSYYCSCPPPLVLDDTQRNCVNSSHLNLDENLSVCWQTVSADFMCQSPLLGAQVTFTDCCCLYGDGWGMECALCPATDSDDFASLCSSFAPPVFPEPFPDSTGPETPERGRVGAPLFFPPFSSDTFPPSTDYGGPEDYEDYSPGGGGRPRASLSLPGAVYRGEPFDGYYTDPGGSPFRPSDPQMERAFGAGPPPPPPRPGTPPLGLAPRPGAYEEEEEDSWGPGPPFPPFGDRSRGGGALRRVYERRYDSYAGLSAAEDCGFLHDCQNGSCIRVDEGYTCDCYHGYQLDMTTMTCTDVNECEDGVDVDFPCVNSRCVNTDGSFRCVCRRGYVMSRRPNHCVAA